MTAMDDLIATASASGPMWQDLAIVSHVSALASAHKQDILVERETMDGYFRVKVRVR